MALSRESIATRGYRCAGNPSRIAMAVRGYRCPQVDGITINVPTGALVLSGIAPNVLSTIVVDIPVGALTLTGLAPSLNFAFDIPTGTLTLTGLQPFANITNIIDVPTGALNLQGLPPVIIIESGDVLIAVPTGALLLQGFPPELLLDIIELPFDEQRRYLIAAEGRIYCVWADGRATMVEPPEMRVYNAGGDERSMEVEFDPDFKIWEVRRNKAPSDEGEE